MVKRRDLQQTKVEFAQSILDISTEQLKADGIRAILLDIEGTITPWDCEEITDEVVHFLKSAQFARKGLITNMHRNKQKRIERIARRVGADTFRYPKLASERKPSPEMLLSTLREMSVEPMHAVMIGDKLFDVIAAKRAGLHTVFWLDRLGAADHWFDKYVYRTIEPFIKKLVR